MKILYITYVDFAPSQYGASMRPQMMYRAFQEEGHEVILLSGTQKWRKVAERRASVKKIRNLLRTDRPDLCYIESPVYPILWHFDRTLIREICRLGIPTAYFTRDCYDRLPELFPLRTDFMGRIKDAWLARCRRLTEKTLQSVNVTYFPTMEMTPFFSYRDMRALPPAGEDHVSDSHPEERTCVYVGGVVNQYGGAMLLEAFHLLNQGEKTYRLILVCREKEWKTLPDTYKQESWLELHHTSGDGLIPLLGRASAGLIIGTNDYWEYTVPIKLYEYMGYGLPVIYVHNSPLDHFMERTGMGTGGGRDADSFAEAIRQVMDDPDAWNIYRGNAVRTLKNDNLWIHRVRQIVWDLTED